MEKVNYLVILLIILILGCSDSDTNPTSINPTSIKSDEDQLRFLFDQFATEIMNNDLSMNGWDTSSHGYFEEREELEEDYRDYSKIVIDYNIYYVRIDDDTAKVIATATFTTTRRDNGYTSTSNPSNWVLKYRRINNEWKITDSYTFS